MYTPKFQSILNTWFLLFISYTVIAIITFSFFIYGYSDILNDLQGYYALHFYWTVMNSGVENNLKNWYFVFSFSLSVNFCVSVSLPVCVCVLWCMCLFVCVCCVNFDDWTEPTGFSQTRKTCFHWLHLEH